jgi:uncharacterized protein YjgD (DUF1641 family)
MQTIQDTAQISKQLLDLLDVLNQSRIIAERLETTLGGKLTLALDDENNRAYLSSYLNILIAFSANTLMEIRGK